MEAAAAKEKSQVHVRRKPSPWHCIDIEPGETHGRWWVGLFSWFCPISFYNKCSQRGSHFSSVTRVLFLNVTLTKAVSQHAKPAEESHFLHGWGVKLCVCPRRCHSPGNTAVDQSHLSLQNGGSARQRLRTGAGQVHGWDAVWAFPRRRHEAVRVGSQALSVLM